jgi:sugar phosphate isomerase/epimerase
MKLSFGLEAYRYRPLENALARLREFGYEGIDLPADRPFAFPDDFDAAQRSALHDLLERHELRVANLATSTVAALGAHEYLWAPFEPSFINPDPAARRLRIDFTRRCLDLAADLGAPTIQVATGFIFLGPAPEDMWRWFLDGVRECASHAAEVGVRIAIELEPSFLIEFPEELLTAVREAGSPWVGALLDVGHVVAVGSDILSAIRLLAPHLFYVHLEDLPGRKHYHTIPGRGTLNLRAIIETLRAVGYAGYLNVELYTYAHDPDGAARESMAYLAPLLLSDQ